MKKSSVKNIIVVYVLVTAVFASHFPLLLNGIINWHDDELFSLLKNIQNGSETIFSTEIHSPLIMMWFWIQYLIGENGYFIYHAVSILLHAVNAVLLFYLILRLKLSISIALATSFIFAIHPFGVESVAFINNQTVLLSLTTIVSTYLFYIEFIESGKKHFFYLAILSAIIFYGLGNPSLSLILGLFGCNIILDKKIETKIVFFFFVLWMIAFGIDIQNSNLLFYVSTLLADSISILRIGFTESAIRIFFPGVQPLLIHPNLLLIWI